MLEAQRKENEKWKMVHPNFLSGIMIYINRDKTENRKASVCLSAVADLIRFNSIRL